MGEYGMVKFYTICLIFNTYILKSLEPFICKWVNFMAGNCILSYLRLQKLSVCCPAEFLNCIRQKILLVSDIEINLLLADTLLLLYYLRIKVVACASTS